MGHETPGDILLDAGTNELEVLVFRLAGADFGVNVAKVREVIRCVKPSETPNMHPSVLGMFNSRGTLIPLVDLAHHLGLAPCITRAGGELEDHRIIITEFNGRQVGFVVAGVEQIHRVSWRQVREAPSLDDLGGTHAGMHLSSTTGVLKMPPRDRARPGGTDGAADERLVLMIDFESIADSIAMQDRLHVDHIDNPDGVDRGSKLVLLAEDSPFMRGLMQRVLVNSGYTRLEVYANGQAAWERLEALAAEGHQPVHAVISDIEMPQMDGLHLTRRIKAHAALSSVPVVLFSSLISEDNIKKGQQVGATLQIPKPELPRMVRLVDLAVTGRLHEAEQAGLASAA